MIAIFPKIYDPFGALIITNFSEMRDQDTDRRISRTKNLAGGASFSDGGFSESDKTFSYEFTLTNEQFEHLLYLERNYSFVNLTNYWGFYSGSIASKQVKGRSVSITFLVDEKES